MEQNTSTITGIILAGGRSSRMGKDKAMIEWNHKTLLQNAVDILKPFCSEILISSSKATHLVEGTILVADELPQQAPLIGIYSCLKKSSNTYNLVLSCDMPLVTNSVLELLISHMVNADLIVPSNNEQLEPLCAIYSKELLPIIEKKIRDQSFSLHDLIAKSKHFIVPFPRMNPDLFSNLNSPEDLKNIM